MLRTLLLLLVGVALVVIPARPAGAQYPPLPPTLTISDITLVPGEETTITGSGWEPGSIVSFLLFSDPVRLGTAEVTADTTFTAELEIPDSVAPGTHTLQVRGTDESGAPRVEELTIEVLAAGTDSDDVATAGATTLAFTGTSTAVGLGLAAVLLIAGGVALLIARRRRRSRLVLDR